MRWNDLYPEWIDEEEIYEIPKCPTFPMPNMNYEMKLDVVVVKNPCSSHLLWSRDVARLHVQLSAAHVATVSQAKYILVLDSCRPLPNLFGCGDIVWKKGNAWLFNSNLENLRQKLALPVGSCELSVPYERKGIIFVFM